MSDENNEMKVNNEETEAISGASKDTKKSHDGLKDSFLGLIIALGSFLIVYIFAMAFWLIACLALNVVTLRH